MNVHDRIPLSAPDITAAEKAAVMRVLEGNQLSLGPELTSFEQEIAARHHCTHGVALSSGTAGLHLALLSLGIGPGDEVIAPSFTFIAVANAIRMVGATVVFAEIDALTLNMSVDAARERISPRTRAILVVHTFGVPAEMSGFTRLAEEKGLSLIEDACEAIGAEWEGQPVGSFGRAAVFGFYPNKQITTGEGGALVTNEAPLARMAKMLRNQGRAPETGWLDHSVTGYNFRLSEMNCALGRVQLGRLEEILARREAVATVYDRLLGSITALERPRFSLEKRKISWFVYVVRLPEGVDRARVQAKLAEAGIATGLYFAPIHQQPAYQNHPQAEDGSLRQTEGIAARTLALPFFNRLEAGQQERVAEAMEVAILE